MTLRRLGLITLGLVVPLAATMNCSSAGDRDMTATVSGGPGSTSGGDATLPLGGSAGQSSDTGGGLNPLCGEYRDRDCDPDDELSCNGYDLGGGTGGTGGSEGSGGSPGGGGSGGSTTPGSAGQSEGGAAGAESSEAGAAGQSAAGSGGIPIDAGPDVSVPSDAGTIVPGGVGCRIQAGDDGPLRVCARAGTGEADAPCTSAADCAAGFACIGEGAAGICRHYCCDGAERSCLSGRYCAERPLIGSGMVVPVCARADNCSLSQPYPCQEGEDCQCPEGTACLVVRGDGTTTCAEPGSGRVGDSCPCAYGHVCSQASGTCLKLCETVSDTDQCDGGVCQAAAMLPEAWGVCINTGGR